MASTQTDTPPTHLQDELIALQSAYDVASTLSEHSLAEQYAPDTYLHGSPTEFESQLQTASFPDYDYEYWMSIR